MDSNLGIILVLVLVVVFYFVFYKKDDESSTFRSGLQINFYGARVPFVVTGSAKRSDGSWGINEVLGSNGNYQRILIPDAENRWDRIQAPMWIYKYAAPDIMQIQLPMTKYNLPKFNSWLDAAANSGKLYFSANLQNVYVNQNGGGAFLNGLNEGTYLNPISPDAAARSVGVLNN